MIPFDWYVSNGLKAPTREPLFSSLKSRRNSGKLKLIVSLSCRCRFLCSDYSYSGYDSKNTPNVSLTWGSGFPLPCDDDVAKIPDNAVKAWQHWPTKHVQVLMTSRTSTGQRYMSWGGGWVVSIDPPDVFFHIWNLNMMISKKEWSSFRLSGGSIVQVPC